MVWFLVAGASAENCEVEAAVQSSRKWSNRNKSTLLCDHGCIWRTSGNEQMHFLFYKEAHLTICSTDWVDSRYERRPTRKPTRRCFVWGHVERCTGWTESTSSTIVDSQTWSEVVFKTAHHLALYWVHPPTPVGCNISSSACLWCEYFVQSHVWCQCRRTEDLFNGHSITNKTEMICGLKRGLVVSFLPRVSGEQSYRCPELARDCWNADI